MLLTEIQSRFKVDSNTKKELELAQKQENRIRFHTSAFNFDYYKFDPMNTQFTDSVNSINKSITLGKYSDSVNTDFFLWVKSILDESKYVRFLQLFELKTAETIEEIFTKLSRCTEAQDRVVDCYFTNEQTELDFEAYRSAILKDEQFFTEKIFEDILQNNHNGILLVDINEEGKPYFFTITISQVLAIDTNKDSQIEYIVFQTKKGIAYAYCDTHYRKFDISKGLESSILLEEYEHNLGYCPAHFLYNSNLSTRISRIVKESVVSKYLDSLDFLLFLNTSQKYLNTYAYPIMEIPSKDCNYTDFKGNSCEGGYLTDVTETENGNQTIQTKCPKCAKNHFIGAGSVIEKDITINPETQSFEYLQDSVKFVAPPVDSIDLSERTTKMKEKTIIFKTTGFFDNNSDTNEQAKNEVQIQSSFETQVSRLQKFQKPLQAAQKFVIDTAAKLLYPNEFLYSVVEWGRNYYLRSEEELLSQLEKLKAANAPTEIIDLVEKEYIYQKLKNKPLLRNRFELISRINLYGNFSFEELNDFYTKGILDNVGFSLAANFNKYLDVFEIEFGDISNYKINLSLKARILEIQNKLQSYVILPNRQTTETSGNATNPQGQIAQ
jgi:hypothetical protein